jgi:hypothetical protein
MIDLKTAHEQPLNYACGDNLVIRTMVDRYVFFLETSSYVIAPVEATEEMRQRVFSWPSAAAEPYAGMIAARPKR